MKEYGTEKGNWYETIRSRINFSGKTKRLFYLITVSHFLFLKIKTNI